MKIASLDLTLDICTEDGSRTRFYQNDESRVDKTLRQLIGPQLFTQPLLTLASEHSVSAIPSRTIDLILARTASPPQLPLPRGWLDAVEASDDTLPNPRDPESAPLDTTQLLVEIHTLGDWMARFALQTAVPDTVHEQRQLWNHILDLRVIPFRLLDGGIGLINPAKIVRVTVSPSIGGIPDTALPADLLQTVRA